MYYHVSTTNTKTVDTMSVTGYYGFGPQPGTLIELPTTINWHLVDYNERGGRGGRVGTRDTEGVGTFFGTYTDDTYGITGAEYNNGIPANGVCAYEITANNNYLLDLRAINLLSGITISDYFITAESNNIFSVTANPGAPDFSVLGLWAKDERDYMYLDAAGGSNFPWISSSSDGFIKYPLSLSAKPANLIYLNDEAYPGMSARSLFFNLTTRDVSADPVSEFFVEQFEVGRSLFATYKTPIITTLSSVSSTSMSTQICSIDLGNDLIHWRALKEGASPGTYSQIITRPPTGEYVNCASVFDFASALGCAGTSAINITAGKDTESIFVTILSATTASSGIQVIGGTVSEGTGIFYTDSEANIIEFKPKRVQITLDELGIGYATLSSSFIDTGGDESGIVTEAADITWTINSTDDLSAGHGFTGVTQTGVSEITLSAGNALTKSLTATIDDQFASLRTPFIYEVTIGDGVTISSTNLGSAIRLVPVYSVSQESLFDVSPSRLVQWTTDTPGAVWAPGGVTGTTASTAVSNFSPYLTLSATALTGTHTITLSAGGDQDSITWRPYLPVDVTTTLLLCTLSSTADADSVLYNMKTLGDSVYAPGTPPRINHNLPLGTTVTYTHTGERIALTEIQDSITLNADFEWDVDIPTVIYGGGVFDSSHDTITATTNPSGSVTFESIPVVNDTYFKPLLQITNDANVNSPSPVVYMSRPSADEIILDVDNSSILTGDLTIGMPGNVVGYVQFNSTDLTTGPVSSITGTTSGEAYTDFISKYLTVSVPPAISSTSISLDVTAYYGNTVETSAVPITKSYSTSAIFVNCTGPTSGDIVIIPEYKWNTGTRAWDQVIDKSTFILQDTIPSFIYGHGRTETLIISAVSSECIGTWDWSIRRASGDIETTIPSDSRTTYNFKTSADGSESIDLILTPYTSQGNIRLPSITATNALSAVYDTPSDINVTVDFVSAFGAPGTLSGIVSASNSTGDMPIDYQITTLAADVSTLHWSATARSAAAGGVDLAEMVIDFTVSDIGENAFSIPKFRTTEVQTSAIPYYQYSYVTHPVHNDWSYPVSFTSDTSASTITDISTGYPVIPHYFLNNKYVELSGGTVSVELDNETVWPTPFISAFEWTTNSVISTLTDNAALTGGPYTEEGTYSIQMVSKINEGAPHSVSDTNGIVVLSSYPEYNAAIDRRVDNYTKPTLQPCGIGSNDWVTAETVNYSLKKIYDNAEALLISSKLYDDPPYEYTGWLGSVNLYNTSIPQFRWFVNIPGLQYSLNNPVPVSDVFSDIKDVVVRDDELWVSDKDSVFLLSDDFMPTKITEENTVGVGVNFNCIRSIELDNVDTDRVYLLDSLDPDDSSSGSRNEVYVFEFTRGSNVWTLLFKWGGLGAASSKYKFRNPGDIMMDSDNFLYVADTDNLVVKKYTRTGSWIKTITNTNFTSTNKPVSLCQTPTGDIHILCGDKVVVVDTGGTQQRTYDINTTGTYRKISSSKNDGFVYAMSDDNVIKCNTDGTLQLTLQYYELSPLFTPAHRAVFQDDFRNLYVAQGASILKFNDQIKLLSLIDEDSIENRWTFDEISVERQEYVQDWVFNKAINRLWDNIEILRKSVLGKLSFKSNLTYASTTAISGAGPTSLEDCTFDWLPGNLANIDNTQTYCYVTPIVRGLLPDEYIEPTYAKDEAIIGINELVTADVINRVLCQLQENIDSIYDMLDQSGDKSMELCDGLSATATTVPDTVQAILTACYPEYIPYF